MNYRFQQVLREELERLNSIQKQQFGLGTPYNNGRDFATRLSHSTMRYYYRARAIRSTHFNWLRSLFSIKQTLSYGK